MAKKVVEITDEEFFTQRTAQIEEAKKNNMEIYPNTYKVTHKIADLKVEAAKFETDSQGTEVFSSAGRIIRIRGHGKLFFFDVESCDSQIQCVLKQGDEQIYEVAAFLRRGDFIGFQGNCGKSRTGELSVFLTELKLLTPCLRVIPLPENGLKDAETIYRKRHIDLLVNKDSKERFIARSKIINSIRSFFNKLDFFEVETPVMHQIHGGAAAKPFKTHHNELKQDLFLRIAPELYLKKLVVGGFDRVFEIGKNFRNEGIDLTHNPEFTSCEAYAAYFDYQDWMRKTEELLGSIALEVKGSTKFTYAPKKRGDGPEINVELDFSAPFKKLDILEELNAVLGLNLTGENIEDSLDILVAAAKEKNIKLDCPKTLNKILDTFIGEYLEPKCINPTFITGFPVKMAPLAKEDKNRKGIVERFELFINGKEIINSYTELNIPSVQRERFLEQVKDKEAGDDEAMPIDEDFCKALEFGLPPTGGWGIGIDRLVMYLTNAANIRDVILFPAMRPENN